jgi:hypothetical protein
MGLEQECGAALPCVQMKLSTGLFIPIASGPPTQNWYVNPALNPCAQKLVVCI